MECQKPNIAEKLVPFVEGALADADRREVMEHLPQCQMCSQEAKSLRQVVGQLRQSAGKNLNYYPANGVAPGDIIDYALQVDKMSDSTRRRIQLQLVESLDAQQEVEWLRELEQDLQKEELIRVPLMPKALMATMEEVYGASPAQAKGGWATLLSGWFSRVGPRPVVAGLVFCAFGAFTVHAAFYRNQGSVSAPAGLAVVNTGSPTSTPLPIVTPAADLGKASKDQVALLPEKVLPEELPRLSRLLWEKKVNHTYRDGQIYVAGEDVDLAWSALNMNEGRLVAAAELKASKVGDKESAGFAGSPDDSPLRSGRKADVAVTHAPSGAPRAAARPALARTTPPDPKPAAPALARTTHPDPKPAAAPAAHTGTRQSHSAAFIPPPKPATAIQPRLRVAPATPPPAPAHQVAVHHPAPAKAPDLRGKVALSGGYNAPRQQQAVAIQNRVDTSIEGTDQSKKKSELAKTVAPPQPTPRLAEKPREVATAHAPASNVATHTEYYKNGPPSPTEVSLPAKQAPVVQTTQAVNREHKDVAPKEEAATQTVTRQQPAPPVDSKIAMGEMQQRVNSRDPRSESVTDGMKPVPKWSDRDKSAGGGATKRATQKGGDLDEVSQERRIEPVGMARSSNSSGRALPGARQGVVSAGAMQDATPTSIEVAMLTNAKKIVIESIGEAEVLIERRDDSSLMVTVKPQRALNQAETEQLRKLLRKKLKLDDADSVVIRQP